MKEAKITLNEPAFTQLCKSGSIRYYAIDIPITQREVMSICNGQTIEKIHSDWSSDTNFKISAELDRETIKEILKRSPIYSGLAESFE